jgi:hypothetical protein
MEPARKTFLPWEGHLSGRFEYRILVDDIDEFTHKEHDNSWETRPHYSSK